MMEWEDMKIIDEDEYAERLMVFGGWLVRTYCKDTKGIPHILQTFVPDPHREWVL
jgi:hypothetical protein